MSGSNLGFNRTRYSIGLGWSWWRGCQEVRFSIYCKGRTNRTCWLCMGFEGRRDPRMTQRLLGWGSRRMKLPWTDRAIWGWGGSKFWGENQELRFARVTFWRWAAELAVRCMSLEFGEEVWATGQLHGGNLVLVFSVKQKQGHQQEEIWEGDRKS